MSFEALKQVYRLNNLDTLLSRTIEYLVGKYDSKGRLVRAGYPKRRLPRVINRVTFPRSDPGFDELYGNAKVTLPDNMDLRIVPSAFGFYHFPKIIKLILGKIEKPGAITVNNDGWSIDFGVEYWPNLYRKLRDIYNTNHSELSRASAAVSEYLTRMGNIGLSYDPCRPNVKERVDLTVVPVEYRPGISNSPGVMYRVVLGDLHTPDSDGSPLKDYCVDVGNQTIETTFGDETYTITRNFGVQNTDYAYTLVDICRSWIEDRFFDLYSRCMAVYQRTLSQIRQTCPDEEAAFLNSEITKWPLWYLQYAYLLADAIRQIGHYTGADYSNANLPAHWHDKMEIRISDNKTVTLGYK